MVNPQSSPALLAAPAIEAEFLAILLVFPQSNDKLLSTAHPASTKAGNIYDYSQASQGNPKIRYYLKKKKKSFLHGHLFPYSNYLTVISCHCCIAQSLRLNISWVYTELRELYDWPQKEQLKIKISRIPF